jgi:hypothetical protein
MNEAIHCSASRWEVGENGQPLAEVTVEGDDGGALLIALADQLIQIALLLFAVRGQAEAVKDEGRDCGDSAQALSTASNLSQKPSRKLSTSYYSRPNN